MMLKNRATQIYWFFLIAILFSCGGRSRVDVSHIDVNIAVERFDQALDSLQEDNIRVLNRRWMQQYGQFYEDYMQHMLEAGDPHDSIRLEAVLREVQATPDYRALKEEVARVFPDLSAQEAGLTDAFRRLKYYFPDIVVPRVISFFSGFAVQTPVGADYVGIGLDMFLGADSKFYPALRESIPHYLSRRFTPKNIVPRVVEAFIREELYPQDDLDVTLLQHMVYHGRVMYLLDSVLPDTPDTLKIGYTGEQLAWANRYERDIWAWFLQENLLYEADFNRIQKYIGEAPFTPELGERNESAPKLGVYIGRQIVRRYMERHPGTTLKELLDIKNAQVILDGARYRGR